MFNINDYKNDIIDAYTEVYGDEYKDIIQKRINMQNILVTISNDNLKEFIYSLKKNKLEDLNVDFYESFIDDDELELCRPSKDNIYSIEDDYPLLYFNDEEPNLEFYENNNSYKSILKHINSPKYQEIKQVFEEYKDKANELSEQLLPKLQAQLNETLKEKYNKEFNRLVISNLPDNIKEVLKETNIVNLDSIDIFDCFSKENLLALKEGRISQDTYNSYIKKYFKIFDLKKVDKSNLKQYIPNPETIKTIQEICNNLRNTYQKEVLMNSDQVKNSPLLQKLIEDNTDKICSPVFGNRVCQLNLKDGNNIEKLIVFPISYLYEHQQDFTLIHELGHSLTTNEEGIIGIENSNIISNIENNNLNKNKRKYEVFNEILTDIFAYRANKKMQEKNQYIFEDKSSSFKYNSEKECNQFSDYVLPLLELIEPEVKKAMITGEQSYIKDRIGEDNFENLNELINSRYNLSHRNDLSDKEFDKQVALTDMKKDELYNTISNHIQEKSKEK